MLETCEYINQDNHACLKIPKIKKTIQIYSRLYLYICRQHEYFLLYRPLFSMAQISNSSVVGFELIALYIVNTYYIPTGGVRDTQKKG